jgi:RNA polymerase sigma-70 factor (ECF subfamily)
MQNPEGILGYLKKVAANVAHDHFKHCRSQSAGGSRAHVSTSDVEVEAGREVHGSQDRIAYQIMLNQIDAHLKHQLTGADQARDRTVFWLYFQQGMSAREIASLPNIGLGPKGVGSVIERLKQCIREHIVTASPKCGDERAGTKSKIPQEFVMEIYGSPEYGTSIR